MAVEIKKVKAPAYDHAEETIPLTDATIEERKKKVCTLMKEKQLSSLIIYADKEHGSNFEYLVGFIPRFEEALLILNQNGESTLLLGNENFNKAKYSRISSDNKCVPLFSLPNQPMGNVNELQEALAKIEIDESKNVGIVGWKLIPEMTHQFDVPQFIIEQLANVITREKLVNATGVMIDPAYGARVTNNANELAHYEYGASLASDAVLETLDSLEEGIKESTSGEKLNKEGQYNSVVTISAFGERFVKGNLYPTEKKLQKGDKVALTVGYRGGLSSRSGYAISNEKELEEGDSGYLQEVVKPYFEAYVFWLKQLKIGKTGGEFYQDFDAFYSKEKFGWGLCPGHLVAEEEWLSSPIYEDSSAVLQSGMIFQVDFIPHQNGHHGVSAESTIALADEALRKEVKENYPELWRRIQERKTYMKEELGISLSKEVLPLASTVGYYRPFFLNKEEALTVQ